ncbi:Ger(x)C family spore germination protein [Neobacillus bataviensis]|uniref:Ger(x)C family spore germination protein n=1 Tax=Neobacillus bataviensis TaxID=220685 RepID=UPI001CBE3A35|nr:Ger(x)C family spore germination protein [Neobacillus bataviensis]
MRKYFLIISLIVLILPALTACWNQKELTDLAFVMAMGIDKGKDKKFDVSFQIVIPANVSAGQNGGGQGLPIAVYKSSGNTLTEAARKATTKVSRRLYYAHTNIVVVSEAVAKKDLLNLIDALDRDPEFRTTTELIVARGTTAENIVTALTNLDKIPVNKITKEIKTTEKMLGENMSVSVDDFLSGLVSEGKEPILSGYSVIGPKDEVKKMENLQMSKSNASIESKGIAIFKDGKFKGWVDGHVARGIVWILNKVESTDINVDWDGKKDAISVAPLRSKTKVSVTFKNGKPIGHINIENESWISEANVDVDITNPDIIHKIEKVVEERIKKQIVKTVKIAQKDKADIFGIGERVHRANPKLWREIKGNWNEHFAQMEVNVKINSFIRREGIRTKPFWSSMKK